MHFTCILHIYLCMHATHAKTYTTYLQQPVSLSPPCTLISWLLLWPLTPSLCKPQLVCPLRATSWLREQTNPLVAPLNPGLQLRSVGSPTGGEPGFSGMSRKQRLFFFLECGILRICVRAELIESPLNLAALTPGRRWHAATPTAAARLCLFFSVPVRRNPAAAAAAAAGWLESSSQSPASVHFQFTFQFQGALLAGALA